MCWHHHPTRAALVQYPKLVIIAGVPAMSVKGTPMTDCEPTELVGRDYLIMTDLFLKEENEVYAWCPVRPQVT